MDGLRLGRGLARALAAVCLLASPAAAEPARFEPAPCPMPDAVGVAPEVVRCGYLVVPESRQRPDARSLRLAVARIPSRVAQPQPDPVVFLHGGPGGSILEHWQGWLDDRLLERRELILLDQRGTGFSQPALCPQLALEDFRILARDLSAAEEMQARIDAALACRDALVADGVDLGGYSSDESAADLADLRRELGFDAWNLFGISYGTKLALTTLRDHPEGIRSVILDSVYPPGIPGNVQFSELARAFGVLLAGCADDPACAETHPDLAAELAQALDGLEERPLEIPVSDRAVVPDGRYFVNAQDLAVSIHQGLYDRRLIPLLPMLIRLSAEREADSLIALIDGAADRAASFNRAVYHGVECFERGPFMVPPSRIGTDAGPLAGLQRRLVFFRVDEPICRRWWDVRAGPEESRAVVSDVPALVFAGEYDPITPPAWGRLAAETLSNHHFLLFPGVGHGASRAGDCPEKILTAFLDDPTRAPDESCIADMPEPAFVTDLRPRPGVYRLAKAVLLEPRSGVRLALGLVLLGLCVGAFGWPLASLARGGDHAAGPDAGARRARRILGVSAGLALAFLAGLVVVIATLAARNPYLIGFGVPSSAAPLFWLPRLSGVLAALGLIVLLPAWGALRPRARLAFLIVATACGGFLLLCRSFGLL